VKFHLPSNGIDSTADRRFLWSGVECSVAASFSDSTACSRLTSTGSNVRTRRFATVDRIL
jgi:hypothetical protein